MILIISTDEDETTNFVIQYLILKKKKFIRLNQLEVLKLDFKGKDIEFSNGLVFFKLSEITSVWYRKGGLNFEFDTVVDNAEFKKVLFKEKIKIIEYIYFLFNKKRHINRFQNSDNNKLITLEIAELFGLQTPKQYLFSSMINSLEDGLDDKYITKLISGDSFMIFKNIGVYCYTKYVDKNIKKKESFFPSLVQKYIQKKYELRIFFLNDKLYSMAIFSQENEKTKIDYRNYQKEKPNRRVPYKLPKEIEEKLILFMKKIELNSGSIDMIVTHSNEYYFLEVNPVGQFGALSYYCNYNIENLIANYLGYE
jgi:ATP-GRASP peptide maturase of grasp-with-spasm system